MYQPPHFVEDNLDVLHDLIDHVGVGLLVSTGPEGPVADLIPFRLDRSVGGKGMLCAHLARANSHIGLLKQGGPVLVVFQTASTYITPSFYKTKQDTGKVVPTWNYVMVQASGTPRVIEDGEWLGRQIRDLTDHHEASQPSQWAVDDAPADFIQSQIKGIVGLEIEISGLAGKWKASQNRIEADRHGVVEGLSSRADEASHHMAALVAGRLKPRQD